MSAETFAYKFEKALRIASIDTYRATTHNKGIFNGIDSVVIATGNDFRAIEACGHAYAARDGQYRSLSSCEVKDGVFRFWLDIPMAIGTVGGLTNLHPLAKRSLEMMGYPSAEEEKRIARETTGAAKGRLNQLLSGEKILAFQQLVRRVPVPEHIYDYAVAIVRKTRPSEADAPAWLKELVGWGAGPRAVQYLILGAKARAALKGSYMVRMEDIEAVASPVLAHRVITNFAAESQGMTSKKVVERLVAEMREQ
jgi:hypothetical protein